MDEAEIVNIFSNFSKLEVDFLLEEIVACYEEIAQITNDLEKKKIILDALNKELSSLQPQVEELTAESEHLDVELIRAKTQKKKLEKNIGKLKSLNATCVKIEVGENDKMKLTKNKTKLSLVKNLLRTFVNSEDKGFTLSPVDWQLKILQLNKNNSKQVNREKLWKALSQSSPHHLEWNQLFS